MFLVRSVSPLDELWEERDELISAAAGRRSDHSSAGASCRDHSWNVEQFDEALAMRKRLARVEAVTATLREAISSSKRGWR